MDKNKWNEEAAMNNNLSANTYNAEADFAEELADGGERNEFAEKQAKNIRKNKDE